MIKNMAEAGGDTLIVDSNTPGGYKLKDHWTNATTLSKIAQGNWDFVVLQEQSQLPSFPISQVQADCFPYAKKLDSLIKKQNPCAQTIYYMTWGRENGDQSNCAFFPPLCTYHGMDSLLRQRYTMMANDNEGYISPVGPTWRYIRSHFTNIDLYSPDESHPSLHGTYAAAKAFYSVLLQKDPTQNAYLPVGITNGDAYNIAQAAKITAFDSLSYWNVGKFDPNADASFVVTSGNQVTFTNLSTYSTDYEWNFGDGSPVSSAANPTHTYNIPQTGPVVVTLTASKCGKSDAFNMTIPVTGTGINDIEQSNAFKVFPNPGTRVLNVETEFQDRYQFQITNALGQKVKSGEMKQKVNSIKIEELPSGVYFISVYSHLKHLGQLTFIKE